MARLNTFTFRIDEIERRLITALADCLHRTQSDAIRWLIYESALELGIAEEIGVESEHEINSQPLTVRNSSEDFSNELEV